MREKILQLRSEGKSYSQISAELGCARSTVAYHVGPGQKEKSFQRTYKKANKTRQYLQDIKNSSGCVDCGEKYPHFMLDFDHRPGEDKVGNLSRIHNFTSMEKVMEEVDKCDVVCANCHRLRTWIRQQESPHPRKSDDDSTEEM